MRKVPLNKIFKKKSRSWILIITFCIYFTPKLPKYQIISSSFYYSLEKNWKLTKIDLRRKKDEI